MSFSIIFPYCSEAGNLVYADGCAHLDSSDNETAPDRDNDGIADNEDTCPDEDASGYDADADGCIDDSDSDGAKDDVDVCPFDANDGCPAALANEETNATVDVPGCVHQSAENYNADATEDDGSCEYAAENFDCNDNCIAEIDCVGECGGDAEIDECGVCGGEAGESVV